MNGSSAPTRPEVCGDASLSFTIHAELRMAQYAIRPSDVRLAIRYGRCFHKNQARHYWVGRREVERWARRGVNLVPVEGLHVVQNLAGGIITVGWRERNPRKHRVGRPRRRRPW